MALKIQGGGHQAKERVWPPEAENNPPSHQPARKRGPQSYNPMEFNSADNVTDREADFPLPTCLDFNLGKQVEKQPSPLDF